MLKRLKLKFVCIEMVLVTVMLCGVFAVLYVSTSRNLERESVQMLQSIAGAPIKPGRPGEAPLPYFSVELDERGRILRTGGYPFSLSDADLDQLLREANAQGGTVGVLPQRALRFCRMKAPWGETVAFADMTSERSTLQNLVRTCLLIALAAFLVFLLLGVLLARWAVRPVERAWKQQKQFVADASHELKTPLTVVLTNAELLQGSTCPEEEQRRFSDNILIEARRMRELVESLLALARMDSAAAQPQLTPLSLSAAVADAILPFEPVFFEKGLSLRAQLEPDVRVAGDPEQLRQVLEILLDNAQKYASSAGEALVVLRRGRRGRCLLTVSNPGEPLGQEELKNIFIRFYRADKARSGVPGCGLGLSIAQEIVRRHGGRIWAESGDGHNTFCVELPALP